MIEIKSLKLMTIALVTMLAGSKIVNAADVCKIESGKLTQEDISDCRIVEISQNAEVEQGKTVSLDNKVLIIDNGVTLTVKGTLNIKDFKPEADDINKVKTARVSENYSSVDSTNVIFEENSKLVIEGLVSSSNTADDSCEGTALNNPNSCPIAFQTIKSKGQNHGEIEVKGGELKIDGFKRGGIAPIKQITASNGGKLTFTNNGYGSNSAPIKLNDGHIVAKGNDVGFTAQLTAEGDSSVVSTENKIIGAVLNDSTIGGNTTLNITGNNTSNNEQRGADLAINANNGVTLKDNAELTVSDVRTYVTNDSGALASGKNNNVVVNGAKAIFTYDKIIENEKANSEGKGTDLTPTKGFVKKDNTITVYGEVEGEIEVAEGETLVIDENAKTDKLKVTALAGAIIKNNSNTALTVSTPNGDITVSKSDKEVKIEAKVEPSKGKDTVATKNPATLDNVLAYGLLSVIALVGTLVIGLRFKKI